MATRAACAARRCYGRSRIGVLKKIAVLTSGGDAPGMNAAVRAVTRGALARGWEVFGVRNGYAGLLNDTIQPLAARDVGGIVQSGGTVLGSARCPEFAEPAGRAKALVESQKSPAVDALVVIGGNGSQSGSASLAREGFPVVGVPSTIDNDLYGNDVSIGCDTAINITLEAIDRLRTTASSHQRAFAVETMGRDCGYIALMAGIAGGAEVIALPESEITPAHVAERLRDAYRRGKTHALAVIAEGAKCGVHELMEYYAKHRESIGFELRVTRLGHMVRGGSPGAADRVLATRLGAAAIATLADGKHGVLVGHRQERDRHHAARRDRRPHAAGRRQPARAGARDGDLELQQLHQRGRAFRVPRVRRDPGREVGQLLHRPGQRADDVDPGHGLELAKLLHADLGLAPCDHQADRSFLHHHALLQPDAQPLDQLGEIDPARAHLRVRDRVRRFQAALERLDRADVGPAARRRAPRRRRRSCRDRGPASPRGVCMASAVRISRSACSPFFSRPRIACVASKRSSSRAPSERFQGPPSISPARLSARASSAPRWKPCDNLIAFHDQPRIAKNRSTRCCSSCPASARARSTAWTPIS